MGSENYRNGIPQEVSRNTIGVVRYNPKDSDFPYFGIRAHGKNFGELQMDQVGQVGLKWKSTVDFSQVDQIVAGIPFGKTLKMEQAVGDLSHIVTGNRYMFDEPNPDGFNSHEVKAIFRVNERRNPIVYNLGYPEDYRQYTMHAKRLPHTELVTSVLYSVKDNRNAKSLICKVNNPDFTPVSAGNVTVLLRAEEWSEKMFEWVLRNHEQRDFFRMQGLQPNDLSGAITEKLLFQ